MTAPHRAPHHIALFLATLGGGGAEKVMVNLAQGLVDFGVRVDFVLASATGPYLPLIPAQVRLIDLKQPRALTSLPGLARYLRREKPDALIAGLDHANLIALFARRLSGVQTKIMVTVNIDYAAFWQGTIPPKDALILRLAGLVYPWADAVVGASAGATESMASVAGLPRHRLQTIYNPVVTPEVLAKMTAPLDHPWLNDTTIPVILGVGRLIPVKDFATLIRAFALLRAERPARLIILGEGSERQNLQSLIHELGVSEDAALPGFVDNPYAYMARARVFALSSKSEALPTVLIEALACGCAVVSTDCPSGPAEILAGGRYGRLVMLGDPVAMAAALRDALAAPPDAAALKARADDFSLAKITREYLAALGMVV